MIRTRQSEKSGKRFEIAMRGCLRSIVPARGCSRSAQRRGLATVPIDGNYEFEIMNYRRLLRAAAWALLAAAFIIHHSSFAYAQTTTTVTDTIHGPDPAQAGPSGQIVISSKSTFTASDGSVVFAGVVANATVANGSFSVSLVPNAGSVPSGTSYSAIYKLSGVPYKEETWVVPSSATPVDLSTVRSATLSGPSQKISPSQLPAVINASSILDKGGQFFNAKAYGAVGDGVTNDTTAVQAAITAAMVAGGTVYFPPGKYLIAGALTLPNDSASPVSNQNPLRLTGSLMDISAQGTAKTPAGGAILNLTETSNATAKIDTHGAGVLEIDHLTLEDTGGDSVPFVFTTNTVLRIHDNAFVGSKNATLCYQDAIVLGGTSTSIDMTANAPFQGYGTVIRDNFFNHIRRAVYGRTYANGIQVVYNTVWNQAGSNLAGGAAIEFLGTNSGYTVGNVINGNLIEMVGYVYGLKFTYAEDNQVTANNLYDPGAGSLANVYFDGTAYSNNLHCGFYSTPMTCYAGTLGSNTVRDDTGQNPTEISIPWTFNQTSSNPNPITLTYTNPNGIRLLDSTDGTAWQPKLQHGASPQYFWYMTPTGGSQEQMLQVIRSSATTRQYYFGQNGDSYALLSSKDGDLRLYAGSSSGVVWLGSSSSHNSYVGGSLAKFASPVQTTAVAFTSLPSCGSSAEGEMRAVTDATANTWGSTITGGGSNHVLAYCDGTAWTVAAK
jgi:Pectate lyase superfamily protein